MKVLRLLFIYLAGITLAIAAPGAHGPNGEHLDGAAAQVHTEAGTRLETFTESFELVARLQPRELSILVDRYATNEPVLNGKLEVESGGMKALAKFHADRGEYSVDDEAMLKALAKPGKHALIFTLAAGEDSDLLEGTLEVKAQQIAHDHAHDFFSWPRLVAAVAAVLAILALLVVARRRQRLNRTLT